MTFGASFSVATQQQLLPPPGHKSFPATPRNHLQGTLSYTSAWHLQPASTPTVLLASKSVDLHQLLPQPNTIRALALSAGDTLAEASDFEQPAQATSRSTTPRSHSHQLQLQPAAPPHTLAAAPSIRSSPPPEALLFSPRPQQGAPPFPWSPAAATAPALIPCCWILWISLL